MCIAKERAHVQAEVKGRPLAIVKCGRVGKRGAGCDEGVSDRETASAFVKTNHTHTWSKLDLSSDRNENRTKFLGLERMFNLFHCTLEVNRVAYNKNKSLKSMF